MTTNDELLAEADTSRYGPEDSDDLIRRLAAALRASEEELDRLRKAIDLFGHLPIQRGESAREPWIQIHLIDFHMAMEVAAGTTDPDEWVSVPCPNVTGKFNEVFGRDYKFSHSPHWWNEFDQNADPQRTPHYCNGELLSSYKPEEGKN